jgi:hypothetical protein
MQPETKYTKSGEVSIAYQVVGDGPRDLVYIPEAWTPLEWQWEEPAYERFLRRLRRRHVDRTTKPSFSAASPRRVSRVTNSTSTGRSSKATSAAARCSASAARNG